MVLPGQDISGIRSGFLIAANWNIVKTESLFREAKISATGYPLFSRPPLLVELCYLQKCLSVMNLHLRSMRGIGSSSKGRRVSLKRKRQAEEIAPDGFPIGIEASSPYPTATLDLNRYSHFLLYTDGVTETRRADGEWFGTSRLQDWFVGAAGHGHSAATLKDQLNQTLNAFEPSGELGDDRTFLLLCHQP